MKKIRKLREKMRKNGIDAAVFLSLEPIDDQNIYYFTGFQQERYHSFACYIVKNISLLSCQKAWEDERHNKNHFRNESGKGL